MTECIVLIGPMGAGKSEVGAALARRLGRSFVETDLLVETDAGASIAQIFEQEGEQGFRAREKAAVAKAAGVTGAVISCGGGALTTPENAEILRRAGTVVYLKVDADTAAARLAGDGSRPLLAGDDRRKRLQELIELREPGYLWAADHVVQAGGDPEEVLYLVLEAVSK